MPRSHLGPCRRCWAWHGAGNGGSSTSGQRSPAREEGALRGGARPCPPLRACTRGQSQHGSPTQSLDAHHAPHPHLQLSHHKLLGQVVPPGLPENRGVAQVVLQIPALGLGREAGSRALTPGSGPRGWCWLPGAPGSPTPPAPQAHPPLMLHFRALHTSFLFYRTPGFGRSGDPHISELWGSSPLAPCPVLIQGQARSPSAHLKYSLTLRYTPYRVPSWLFIHSSIHPSIHSANTPRMFTGVCWTVLGLQDSAGVTWETARMRAARVLGTQPEPRR